MIKFLLGLFKTKEIPKDPYVLVSPCYQCPGQGGCSCDLPLIRVPKAQISPRNIHLVREVSHDEAKKYHDLQWLAQQ